MARIVGVKFRGAGKSYYFDPGDEKYKKGDKVLVETARGMELGDISFPPYDIDDSKVREDLKPVIRRANKDDEAVFEENLEDEKRAYNICLDKIRVHELDMNLIGVQYTFDRKKITFYFTADQRVDFRELVKDLASIFHTRIELRQIGIRDECRLLGGVGVCGREFCCSRFLPDFQTVTIKMAKEQGKTLSPTKISGSCGRLMCCLKYEQDMYDELVKLTPPTGTKVSTPDGTGVVVDSNVLMGNVKVRLDGSDSVRPYASASLQKIFGWRPGKNTEEAADPELEKLT
ncbi:MAG: stage 0 sporulation family protein [Oscillospiraceae bacterium]|nr:stage 0 sporulation family protein [Oscillospiraceae bacterium]